MIYLTRFSLPGEATLSGNESRRTCYTSHYPFGVFRNQGEIVLELEPVTILCGGNGSGKTTILNLMGEKLGLRRGTVFNCSSFFGDYLAKCRTETTPAFREAKENSRVITSDDVFDYLLDLRYLNENIDHRRRELLAEYAGARYAKFQMHSMEDIDRLRQVVDAQRKTGSRYVRDRVMNDVPEKSNGESAFAFFTKEIQEEGLYLLDEPENSLSPKLQRELVGFLEDSVRFYRCQFVISTHSPFLLAMKDAKIYDLDSVPVRPCRWTELEHIQAYWQFFREHRGEFED